MSILEGHASVGRVGRVTASLLQVLALLIAVGALALGVTQAVLVFLDERLSIAYPVRVAIPQESLLSIPGMSIDSARFSEVSIAVSGVSFPNRLSLAISALLAAAGIVAIALMVVMLCRRVLRAAPMVPVVPAALVAAATALLVGIGGSQVFLFAAQWGISEHWDGHPLFGSGGGFDTVAASLALDWTPVVFALLLYFLAGVLGHAHRRERVTDDAVSVGRAASGGA